MSAKRITTFSAVVLLLGYAALAVYASRDWSPTYDEPPHIVSGLAYWQLHDTRLNPEHPPLLKMLAAAPLAMSGEKIDFTSKSFCYASPCEWYLAREHFDHARDPERLVRIARLPMIWITVLLGLVIFRITANLAGNWGALLAVALFATSPFFLGYGALVITDIGVTLFVLLAAWMFAEVQLQPTGTNILLFALALSGAWLSKFSAGLLLPSFVLCWLFEMRPADPLPRKWKPVLIALALSAAITGLFYLIFCGNSSEVLLLKNRIPSMPEGSWPRAASVWLLRWVPAHSLITAPLQPLWLYLGGMLHLLAWADRPTYLLGSLHQHGTWYYFPALMLFRTPPALLIALLIAGISSLLRLRRIATPPLLDWDYRLHAISLACTGITFFVAAMLSHINIGMRHVAVPIAVLTIFSGLVPAVVRQQTLRPRAAHAITLGLIALSMFTAWNAFPNYISYFNPLIGEMTKQEIATDSNLDWGQSLLAIEQYRREGNIGTIYVNANTYLDGSRYVKGAKPWVCDQPPPPDAEWLAVSANFLTKNEPACTALMRLPHEVIADGTTFIFRLPRH